MAFIEINNNNNNNNNTIKYFEFKYLFSKNILRF